MNRLHLISICSLSFLLLTLSCQTGSNKENDVLSFVNPFIGTGGHGHTYPGASSPFGMVQLSPDTRLIGWDGCSGYHYSDSIIYGFSHTHLSGTGVSDYGDILLMPVNNGAELTVKNLSYADYKSPFYHTNEQASPGFYQVLLDKPNVLAKLSTTARTGTHQYTFNNPESPAFVLDLEHRDEVLGCDIKVVDDYTVTGFRNSKAWADDQRVFFVMTFSAPMTGHSLMAWEEGEGMFSKAIFNFDESLKEITVKVAISAVDQAGAQKNYNVEIKAASFEEIKEKNEEAWRSELNKIVAQFSDKEEQTIFYTALYHSMLAPNIYNDVDGRYRGMDQEIYEANDRNQYTVFSLWDTYRAAHPLYTIIDQKRTTDFVNTMLSKYEHGGILPIWDLSACYTGCMIGYHGVSVIADAHAKGIQGFDEKLALKAMIHSAEQSHLGLEDYMQNGFISLQNEPESVSKTLEYAYDDWCIAAMAERLGETEISQTFFQRSLHYRNLFDPETKFFRPRRNNLWLAPFDPFEVNSNFTEANAWHYGFSAPQDMSGFIDLHGGKAELEKALDDLFTASSETTGRDQADITGLIGQYAHGNEPSHHIAYLYNYVNKPWKTQQRVRQILSTQYHNAPDGVSGNEDCGQMSAWYVMSALGFYAVLPGSTQYVIGSPAVDAAKINLENGQSFEITTDNNSATNIYIQSVTLNGEAYTKSYLDHTTIMAGGTLHLEMGPEPNIEWGSGDTMIPTSQVEDAGFVYAPYIEKGRLSFADKNAIALASAGKSDQIYFRINEEDFQAYEGEELMIKETATIEFYAQNGDKKSAILSTSFVKIDNKLKLDLQSEFAAIYDGGTPDALIDGLRGGKDYRTGFWQGFEGQNLECVVDLGETQTINQINCGFLQDENSWIFFPSKVEYFVSTDGENFKLAGTYESETKPQENGTFLEDFALNVNDLKARYVKMKAHSLINCPTWHKGAAYGGKAWVFADEVVIK